MLDVNLPADQRQLLRKWRIRFRCVGADVGASGTVDENLIPLLHRLDQPTFFSLDRDFYRCEWGHPDYCLVWLDVRTRDAAKFMRRFIKHSTFDTRAKRMGVVARAHPGGVMYWQLGKRTLQSLVWQAEF